MHGGSRVTCSNPIDRALLADYWLAALAQPEEDAVEEHLFGCEACAARLRETVAFAEGIRNLARDGALRLVVSDAFVRRAVEQGVRVREYAVPAGGSVACTVTAEDDMLISRLAANLRDAKRVDLCFCDERGVEQLRLPDIPVRAGAAGVAVQHSITHAKALPSGVLIARLLSVEEDGAERLIGEYTFNHTRTLPGPGARGA